MLAFPLLLLFATLLVLAIGHADLVGTPAARTTNNTIKLGGWIGIVLALTAWYMVLAALMESTFGARCCLLSRSAAERQISTTV